MSSGGRVDVIDPKFQEQFQGSVSFFLGHGAERCGSKDGSCALMACPAECFLWDHIQISLAILDRLKYRREMPHQFGLFDDSVAG